VRTHRENPFRFNLYIYNTPIPLRPASRFHFYTAHVRPYLSIDSVLCAHVLYIADTPFRPQSLARRGDRRRSHLALAAVHAFVYRIPHCIYVYPYPYIYKRTDLFMYQVSDDTTELLYDFFSQNYSKYFPECPYVAHFFIFF